MSNGERVAAILAGVLLTGFLAPSDASVVLRGSDPITAFDSLELSPEVEYLTEHSLFRYTYTLSNHEHNTDSIATVFVDIRQPPVGTTHAPKPIPQNGALKKYHRFKKLAKLTSRAHGNPGHNLQNVAVSAPYGWHGMPLSHGYLQLSAMHPQARTRSSIGLSFELLAHGPPKITEAIVLPSCNGMGGIFRGDDSTCSSKRTTGARRHLATLTPSGLDIGSPSHVRQFREDIGLAYRLFWIKDLEFKEKLRQRLSMALEHLEKDRREKAAGVLTRLHDQIHNLGERTWTDRTWTSRSRLLITENLHSILRTPALSAKK